MERGIQEIQLPGGQTVLATVRVLDPGQLAEHTGGDYDFEDTGALDRLGPRIEQLNELVTGVGSAVLEAARAVRPDEVSATFGVEIGVKPGRAVAMLADGGLKGTLSITLKWLPGQDRSEQDGDQPPGARTSPVQQPVLPGQSPPGQVPQPQGPSAPAQ